MSWAASRVDHRTANLLGPPFNATPVKLMHVFYCTENTRVVRRTRGVGMENLRISHATSVGTSKRDSCTPDFPEDVHVRIVSG